jgi:integrase/recombinase XerD
LADYFQSRSHLKPASRFADCMALRSFYRFLQARGLAIANPALAIQPPAPKSRLPDLLSEEEVGKLLSLPAARFPQIRDRAIMELLYCGLRVSEALGLEHDQIHIKEGCLQTMGKGNRSRWVPFGIAACEALERYF